MDVILSIVAGLGLRIFLITAATPGPGDGLTAALLGIWEGIIVHQLSARSHSSHLDHVLAYVLRLVADLFISKNLLRLCMVLLWTAFGSLMSEAVSPYASLRSALRRRRDRGKERERERERRHRHSRSSSETLPILSTPLPLRVRTYTESHSLPSQAPQQSSTPLASSIPPQTPPSFFLQGTSDIDSPSPKPVHLQLLQPPDSPTRDSLPVRPPSGLASILDRFPHSSRDINVHNLLPTPPESARSAVPSDPSDIHDTTKTLSPHRLSPIAEVSSPDSTPPDTVNQQNRTEFDQNQRSGSPSPLEAIFYVPPPAFNAAAHSSPLLTTHSTKQNADEIFTTPFSPIMSPAAPIPVPIPQRNRLDPLWQTHTTPRLGIPCVPDQDYNDDLNTNHDNIHDKSPDSDELQTPGLRDTLNAETDNEDDPLLTPMQMKPIGDLEADRGQLSPLGLNVNSGPGSEDYIHFSDVEENSSGPLSDALANNEVLEELHIPGSLSGNLLLQPPLPPSGSFPRASSSPVPPSPSPSTIFSDISMLSQLSTRIPSKLFLKADEYRKQARQEEQSRELLDIERKTAEAQGRTAEALMLKIRVRELDDKVYKLHEKAARRYYAGKPFYYAFLYILLNSDLSHAIFQPVILRREAVESICTAFVLEKHLCVPNVHW